MLLSSLNPIGLRIWDVSELILHCEKMSKTIKKKIRFKTFSIFSNQWILFHFQFCALIIGFGTTGLTISSLLLYVIPETYSKVFYALWVCLFYVFFSGIYSIMAPVIQTTFGQLNYARDFGLVFTQSVSTLCENHLIFKSKSKLMFSGCAIFFGKTPWCHIITALGQKISEVNYNVLISSKKWS